MGRIVAKLRRLATIVGRNNEAPGNVRPGYGTSMAERKRKPHLPGAMVRGFLVAVLAILPAVLIPATTPETAQIMLLLAVFAGGIVFAEYASTYPGLIEFRFAAPFNRTRFLLLALTATFMALLLRHQSDPGPFSALVQGLASACFGLLDFGGSPVRLLTGALPDALPVRHLAQVGQGAALTLVIGATTVLGFIAAIRLNVWPMGKGPFNVWINLPTFDPTAGHDVVLRLLRQARISILLGLLLPFLLPGLVHASSLLMQPLTLQSPMGFVWGIVLWGYVPVSLVMRGVAMIRVARMIRANRRHFADSEARGYAVA
ncbi:MAG: hypothetical protein HLUCCA12_11085 [Rhodobacteraceae bacterium HLUCCA12]|nr:MAG: hypothetical protein HLUCCA12_11085 [Rhodobacteraceae bacterium HLUCCA12]